MKQAPDIARINAPATYPEGIAENPQPDVAVPENETLPSGLRETITLLNEARAMAASIPNLRHGISPAKKAALERVARIEKHSTFLQNGLPAPDACHAHVQVAASRTRASRSANREKRLAEVSELLKVPIDEMKIEVPAQTDYVRRRLCAENAIWFHIREVRRAQLVYTKIYLENEPELETADRIETLNRNIASSEDPAERRTIADEINRLKSDAQLALHNRAASDCNRGYKLVTEAVSMLLATAAAYVMDYQNAAESSEDLLAQRFEVAPTRTEASMQFARTHAELLDMIKSNSGDHQQSVAVPFGGHVVHPSQIGVLHWFGFKS